MASYAFVTLLTSDSYLPGALVTAHSIKQVEKAKPRSFDLVCLITLNSISVESIKALRKVYNLVVSVDDIRSSHCKEELNLLGRQDLSSTVTKIHIWRLVQYQKVIYVDADTLLLRPLSHLFELDSPFSACPDVGWPDCFNSGLMVIRPENEVFEKIYEHFMASGSWDGGDQGLLNDFFTEGLRSSSGDPAPRSGWNRLSFIYNVTPSTYYTYAPAYKRFGDKISMIHFIGQEKPWHLINRRRYRNSRSYGHESPARDAVDYDGLVDRWLDAYEQAVGPIGPSAWVPTLPEFHVPKYTSQWDHSQPSAYQPPTLDELKEMFIQNRGPSGLEFHRLQTVDGEGGYLSLSLPDRYHALREMPSHLKDDESQEAADPKYHMRESHPEHHHDRQHHIWDASRSPPPAEGYQMNQPIKHHYESVWDKPFDHQGQSFFQPPPTNHPIGFIPSVTHQDYSQFSSEPRQDAVKAVFPWEGRSRHQVGRIFPLEETAYGLHGEDGTPGPDQPTNCHDSDALTARPNLHSPPHVAQTVSLSQLYRNAWDEDPNIGRWAQSRQFRAGGAMSGASGWDQIQQARATLARTPHLEFKSFLGGEEYMEDGRTGARKEEVVGKNLHFGDQTKQITLSYRMRRDSENSSRDADEEDVGEDDEPGSEEGDSLESGQIDAGKVILGGLSAAEVASGNGRVVGVKIPSESSRRNVPVGPMSRLPTMRSMIIGLPVRMEDEISQKAGQRPNVLGDVAGEEDVRGLEIMEHGGAIERKPPQLNRSQPSHLDRVPSPGTIDQYQSDLQSG